MNALRAPSLRNSDDARRVAERNYLKSLDWDDNELELYTSRVLGIEQRYERVMERRGVKI